MVVVSGRQRQMFSDGDSVTIRVRAEVTGKMRASDEVRDEYTLADLARHEEDRIWAGLNRIIQHHWGTRFAVRRLTIEDGSLILTAQVGVFLLGTYTVVSQYKDFRESAPLLFQDIANLLDGLLARYFREPIEYEFSIDPENFPPPGEKQQNTSGRPSLFKIATIAGLLLLILGQAALIALHLL